MTFMHLASGNHSQYQDRTVWALGDLLDEVVKNFPHIEEEPEDEDLD